MGAELFERVYDRRDEDVNLDEVERIGISSKGKENHLRGNNNRLGPAFLG